MENKKLTPHFFFLSIGVLVTLIATVSAFLNLAFSIFDRVFPDVLTASYQYGYAFYSFENMRSALAVLIIVFPVFLALSRFWIRAQRKEMSQWDSIIRKWVLYLILFLASVTIIIDLVTLVRYFVSGEITARFILKVAVTLIAAGIAGYYYVGQLRGISNKRSTLVLVKSVVLVLAAVIWAFCVMGSPMSQRDLRLDQRRMEDLQAIQWQIISRWQQKGTFPEKLEDLPDPLSSYMIPRDPEFQKGRVYEYKKLAGLTFELCATFSEPMPEGWVDYERDGRVLPMMDAAISSRPYMGGGGESWDHEAGRTCYERTIDPELYPPYPKAER